MDKQKQIEELAKDMGIAFQLSGTTRFAPVAELLVECGYRKIPENVVVIPRKELEENAYLKQCADNFLADYKKGFKEGVQAVQVQLEEGLSKYDKHYTLEKGSLLEWLYEICKELTEVE